MANSFLENGFNREDLSLRLEKIAERNRPAISLFAARCVLRAFRLMAQDHLFEYWIIEGKGDCRAHYLLALWRGILCSLVYDKATADKNASLVTEAASTIKGTSWYQDAYIAEAASYVNASVHISIAAASYAVHFARLAFENSTQQLDFDNKNEDDLRLIENAVSAAEAIQWIELGEYYESSSLGIWKNSVIKLADLDATQNKSRAVLVRTISDSYQKISIGQYSDSEARRFLNEINSYFDNNESGTRAEPKKKPRRKTNPKETPPSESVSTPENIQPTFKFTASRQQAAEAISEEDHLNRKKLVETLASFLAHPANYHHQTLGLLGDWGVGKSSFIHLLKESILKNHSEQRFLFGEFNAWAYENTDNLQAGIAQEIIKALSSPEPRLEDFKRKSKEKEKPTSNVEAIFKRMKRSTHWYFERILLVIQFAITLNGRQILRLAASIFIAICPWLPVFADPFNNLLAWLTSHSDPYIATGGRILWVGGFLFYLGKELRTLLANPMAKELLTYIRLPNYAKHLGTIPQMRKNIETLCRVRLKTDSEKSKRLLFVVDDLDRCGHQAIVKVLEAVRLVLDIQNVMVVIAVDQRIALSALALHYKDFAQYHNSKDSRSIARDYLAKVIHLPITLQKPRGKDVEAYLKFIWSQMITEEHKTILAKETPPPVGEPVPDTNLPPSPENIIEQLPANEPNAMPPKPTENTQPADVPPTTEPSIATTEAALVIKVPTIIASLSTDHQNAFLYWVDYFELSNPRQVKRLNNSYNLLHSYYDYDSAPIVHGLKETHKKSLVFPMMFTLFIMEYLNTLDDQLLRIKIKAELRKPIPKKGTEEEPIEKIDSTLLSTDIIFVVRQLNEALATDFTKVVEPFVLPAIECH